MMEAGEAAIAPYYAGDYFTMLDAQAENVDLRFYYPEPTNYFVDAMCIPSCCQNKELAEIFINYMLLRSPPLPMPSNSPMLPYSPRVRGCEVLGIWAKDAIAILYPGIDDFSRLL